MPNPIDIASLTHRYKGSSTPALQSLDLSVLQGEIFGLLGPNGGGKTTLFRILATLLRPTSGRCEIFGMSVLRDPGVIRRQTGIVFQSPSLDKRLTVRENMLQQGHLYGLSGPMLRERSSRLLKHFGLEEKVSALVETLSGGLKRRVELAKGLLHKPRLLLLDEPSTGLDPAARRELWHYLATLRKEEGVTILLTTHIMEEAQGCDRLAILDRGSLIALGTPDELKQGVGGDVIIVQGRDAALLGEQVRQKFSLPVTVLNDTLRIERSQGHEFVAKLAEAFPGQIDSISVGKPTLEDVFIHKTGHRFVNGQ
jgi:ABC-2 type transport system ATP-binding protein